MDAKERLKKAREAQKPEIVYDDKYYRISKIPLNYRIDIKKSLLKKIPAHQMDRDCYSDLELGLDEAHAVAKMIIERHFKIPTEAEKQAVNLAAANIGQKYKH